MSVYIAKVQYFAAKLNELFLYFLKVNAKITVTQKR